jgi:hypothetical protein
MPVSLASSSAASMHGAMVPIASQTLTNSTSSDVTFTNIPQIYQDLMLVGFARRTDAATTGNVFITPYYTGIGASPQSTTILEGTGSSASSFRYTSQDGAFIASVPAASTTSGIFGSITWHCLNYANTTTFKTSIARVASDTNGGGITRLAVNLTRGTGGITTVNCSTFSGSAFFVSGTNFTLYGIRSVGQ